MKFFIFSILMGVVAAGQYNKYSSKDGSYAPNKMSYNTGYMKEYTYPPKPYKFAYKVNDDYTYTDFSQYEEGDDKGSVSGSYRVLQPDGRTQIVDYTANDYTGYVAEVKYEGEAKYPEYNSGYKGNNYKSADYSSGSYKMKKNYDMYQTPLYRGKISNRY